MDKKLNEFAMDLQEACLALGWDFDPATRTELEIAQLYELWREEDMTIMEFAWKYCGGEDHAEGKSGARPEG